jgi:hypothetical protein
MALFRGAVGTSANPLFLDTFDPLYTLPPTLSAVTRVDQGFTFSPKSPDVSLVLENFTSAATFTPSNLASFARGTLTEHSAARQVGLVTWTFADSTVYLESDWASGPIDVSGYSIFEFDVDRQQNALNPVTPTNFHVQLVQGDGSLSDPLSANNYAVVDGPQGGPGGIHAMLKTARVPLGDFTSIDLTQIAGVRFTFDDTTSGAIFFSTIAVDMAPPAGMGANAAIASSRQSLLNQGPIPANVYSAGNTIEGARLGQSDNLGMVIVDLATDAPIGAKDELTIVKIGSEEFDLVDYRDGDPHRLSVMIPEDRFFTLPQGSDVIVQYGRGNGYGDKWIFPALNNGTLNR